KPTSPKAAAVAGAAEEVPRIAARVPRVVDLPERVPPPNYVCFRCGQKGHYINNCPTNGDKEFDKHPRIKRTTGIPRSFLKVVEEPKGAVTSGGVMVTPRGDLVVAQADSSTWDKLMAKSATTLTLGTSSTGDLADLYNSVPVRSDLECPICKGLFREAVVIPCCGTTYCDECIRVWLLEKEFTCESCGMGDRDLDGLVPNVDVRESVDAYLREFARSRLATSASVAMVRAESRSREGSGEPAEEAKSEEAEKDVVARGSTPVVEEPKRDMSVDPPRAVSSEPVEEAVKVDSGNAGGGLRPVLASSASSTSSTSSVPNRTQSNNTLPTHRPSPLPPRPVPAPFVNNNPTNNTASHQHNINPSLPQHANFSPFAPTPPFYDDNGDPAFFSDTPLLNPPSGPWGGPNPMFGNDMMGIPPAGAIGMMGMGMGMMGPGMPMMPGMGMGMGMNMGMRGPSFDPGFEMYGGPGGVDGFGPGGFGGMFFPNGPGGPGGNFFAPGGGAGIGMGMGGWGWGWGWAQVVVVVGARIVLVVGAVAGQWGCKGVERPLDVVDVHVTQQKSRSDKMRRDNYID
ncbi:hypothetical protein BC938DRAFT_478920, partial [Jimgerdemannia flammicorona]